MWKEALLIGPSRIFTLYEMLIFTIFVIAKGGGQVRINNACSA